MDLSEAHDCSGRPAQHYCLCFMTVKSMSVHSPTVSGLKGMGTGSRKINVGSYLWYAIVTQTTHEGD